MNHNRLIRYLLTAVVLLASLAGIGAVTPTDLRCEYRDNLLGIDNVKPRLEVE